MLFSSIPFLYTFLPCVLILYFLVPGWLKNTVLLLSSLFFYAWGEPRFVVFMVIAIVQGYVFGLLAEKFRDRPKQAKLCLWASAVVSLGLLCYCKYADFFISGFNTLTGLSLPLLHVALPIGISFYTFQILSYVIDVYRGDVTAQRNLIDLAAYVAMFPQLIAGPIVRYADIAPQLKHRTHTLADAAYGARRFILGLSKKVLLANVLYELISAYKSAANVSVLFVWLYAAAYVLHLYFDFSGYSDMAIGLGRIFGFHFIENFNYPYISASVTEFWRRWHMSLGSWFRDYVYIPLGGNRVSKAKWFRNIFIVWLLTGLWHGAAWTFILWGLFFAVFLTAEKLWYGETLAQTRFLKHLYVLLLIAVSFVIFDAASVSDAFRTIGSLFGLGGLPRSDVLARYYFDSYSGGVTTGPMTVPFIMALGLGVSSTRSDGKAGEDSFGLVALCSVGPVLAVLTLALAYPAAGSYVPSVVPEAGDSRELWRLFAQGLPVYAKEMGAALVPIAAFFAVFQVTSLHLPRKNVLKITVGLLYTYIGLVLFMTGVNVGFLPAGSYLGRQIAALEQSWVLIPIGMLMGWFIVQAEPAVHVLNRQVEELTSGAIPGKAMSTSLSIGVAVSIGLAMLRVLTGVSIFVLLVPGYLCAIGLSFVVPKIFTAIAFDSGGVASGPMTATFLLPFAMGACETLGGNVVTDAFGVVAMVAMTPLITIQLLGLVYQLKLKKAAAEAPAAPAPEMPAADDEIIEL